MIEQVYNYANSLDASTEPRALTDSERVAAMKLLQKYFKDTPEALELFLVQMNIVPSAFYGSTFFTKESLTFIEDMFKNMPDKLCQIKAEYFHNLLGMDVSDARSYVQSIDCLRAKLKERLNGGKVLLSDFKAGVTKEDLENSKNDKDRLEAAWDSAMDRCMPYSRSGPNDECLRAEQAYEHAANEYYIIERSLKVVDILDEVQVRSAIAEYRKNFNHDDRTRG